MLSVLSAKHVARFAITRSALHPCKSRTIRLPVLGKERLVMLLQFVSLRLVSELHDNKLDVSRILL